MDYAESINNAIDYVEANIRNKVDYRQVARCACMSCFHFQRVFSAYCGCTLGDYLRNRRMYLSACELQRGAKVTDVAFCYGYNSVEGFARAFAHFHGVNPSKVTADTPIRVFDKITVKPKENTTMKYDITQLQQFTVIGLCRTFNGQTSYEEIPKFWDEFNAKYGKVTYQGQTPANDLEKALSANCVGELGICLDDGNGETFRYMIAGFYHGGDLPQGLTTHTFPAKTWAKFPCVGPMPDSLQTVNTEIFSQWLPNNGEFLPDGDCTVEWYSAGDTQSNDYRSEIWIPVKRI